MDDLILLFSVKQGEEAKEQWVVKLIINQSDIKNLRRNNFTCILNKFFRNSALERFFPNNSNDFKY